MLAASAGQPSYTEQIASESNLVLYCAENTESVLALRNHLVA